MDILFTVDAAGDSAVTQIVKSSSDLLRYCIPFVAAKRMIIIYDFC